MQPKELCGLCKYHGHKSDATGIIRLKGKQSITTKRIPTCDPCFKELFG